MNLYGMDDLEEQMPLRNGNINNNNNVSYGSNRSQNRYQYGEIRRRNHRQEQEMRQIKMANIYCTVLELVLYTWIFLDICINRNERQCGIPINMWLATYIGVFLINVAVKLANIITEKQIPWLRTFGIIYIVITMVFLFCWLIYGNVLYYSPDNDCEVYDATYSLNFIMLMLLIIGYLQMLGFLVVFLLLAVALCVHYAGRQQYMEENNIISENEAIRLANGLMRTEFNPEKHTGHTSCIICLVDFNQEDQVTVLSCNENHYFHTDCLAGWVKSGKNNCPLCRETIKEEDLQEN